MRSHIDDRLFRIRAVLDRVPVGKSTWYRGVASGLYPAPLKLGPGVTVWRASDIDALIRDGVAVSRSGRQELRADGLMVDDEPLARCKNAVEESNEALVDNSSQDIADALANKAISPDSPAPAPAKGVRYRRISFPAV